MVPLETNVSEYTRQIFIKFSGLVQMVDVTFVVLYYRSRDVVMATNLLATLA